MERKAEASFDTDALIAAYRQMILRGHARGIKVLLGTILPFKGAGYWSPGARISAPG
jgi:hypothetical protein